MRLADIFLRMIQSNASEEEIEELEEAGVLQDVSHMPARVNVLCLVGILLEQMLNEDKNNCRILNV